MPHRNRVAWMWLALSACSAPDADLPETYRALAVPTERLASDPARRHGRALFLEHCVLCHGVRADGDGVRSPDLNPRPADFTRPDWRRKTTPRQVFYTIREGRRGTAMAAWPSLSDDEVWDLAAYLLSVSENG
jgi:mono/diheme cytochrome c family protein